MMKPVSKAALKRLDQAIGVSYARQSSGRLIDVFKIGKFYAAVRTRLAAGEDLDAAVKTEIAVWTIPADSGADEGCTLGIG